MKQLCITALLIVVATFGIAHASQKLSKDVEKGIQKYNKIYFDSGINGLQKAIPHCYKKASHKKQREYTEQCMMLDMMSYQNQKQMDSLGLRFDNPYLSNEKIDTRMREALRNTGITDKTEQDLAIQNISQVAQNYIGD